MSILINSIEMPTCCEKCIFKSSSGADLWKCTLNEETFNSWEVGWGDGTSYIRHKSCPLAPVPPHGDLIDRNETIKALWKALYEYEDMTEKQFVENSELDVADWILHRIFVQNMSDIDRQIILQMPTVVPADESNIDSFIHIFEEDDEEDGMDSFIHMFEEDDEEDEMDSFIRIFKD